MKPRLRARLGVGALLLYCACALWPLLRSPNAGQWDLNAYYYAGKAVAAGLNPYERQRFSDWRVDFIYPPATLPLCYGLSRLTPTAAHYVYLGLKLVALALLVWLWRAQFVREDADVVFYLLCLAGFNGAIYLDVRAGNVSVFEQLGLWLALAAFLRGRRLTFALVVAATASLKLMPLLFLVVLLLDDAPWRSRVAAFAAGVACFALIHGVAFAAKPDLTRSFVARIGAQAERGISNPATWPALQDLFDAAAHNQVLSAPPAVQWLVYALVCLVLAVPAGLVIRRLRASGEGHAAVYVACLTYALIVPRFKDYSYILLIVPAWWVVKQFKSAPAYLLLALALVFSPAKVELPGFREFMECLVWPYYPLVLAYVLWAMGLTAAMGKAEPGAEHEQAQAAQSQPTDP